MTNSGYSEMLSLNNRKNSQGEQVRTITIKSRLSDTIRFQSLGGVHSIFDNNPKKEKVEDSFDRFSEMYQWLKECINELTISEVNVRRGTDKESADFAGERGDPGGMRHRLDVDNAAGGAAGTGG
jgi:hypothetical protein